MKTTNTGSVVIVVVVVFIIVIVVGDVRVAISIRFIIVFFIGIQGSEELKPAPKLTKELCHIDWTRSTDAVYNLVRGLSPYPAAFAELVQADSAEKSSLKIYRTEKRPDLHAEPGTVLSDGKSYFAIATADGALALTEIQLAGKKKMAVAEFLKGFRDPQSWKAV